MRTCAEASAASNKPLVVVGSLNADMTLSIPRLPKGGETMLADGLSVFPGEQCFSLGCRLVSASVFSITRKSACPCAGGKVSGTQA